MPAESIFLPAALEELGAMVYGSDLINALPKVTLDTWQVLILSAHSLILPIGENKWDKAGLL